LIARLQPSRQIYGADSFPRRMPRARSRWKTPARLRDTERARDARIAELEQVLGPLQKAHDAAHHAEGFSIRRNDLLGRGFNDRHRAEIQVRSWHCLMMIAKLVAEDARIAALPGIPTAEEMNRRSLRPPART